MPNSPWPYPFWIAHRGAGAHAPENTLAAFRIGAAHGFRAFECDVKLSADGVPFLLHDDTLNRTTNQQGDAGERTWADLALLDAGSWHGRLFAGEAIPSFEAVARHCLANHHALNIELKPSPGAEWLTGERVGQRAAELWASQPVPPLLSSFEPRALEGARAAAPHLPRALLLEALDPGWLDTAQALGCVAIVCHHPLLSREVIEHIHDSGMRALAYTVNQPSDADRLREAGIDGLITDAIDRFPPAG